MDFNDADFRTIKEYALHEFLDKKINYKRPDDFLARCYANATIHFLISQGFEITKKENENVQE
jgi:hypothetical protein